MKKFVFVISVLASVILVGCGRSEVWDVKSFSSVDFPDGGTPFVSFWIFEGVYEVSLIANGSEVNKDHAVINVQPQNRDPYCGQYQSLLSYAGVADVVTWEQHTTCTLELFLVGEPESWTLVIKKIG